MAEADPNIVQLRPFFQTPTSQERGDDMLMRWRLARQMGLTTEQRLRFLEAICDDGVQLLPR
jgi:hypothetical protein